MKKGMEKEKRKTGWFGLVCLTAYQSYYNLDYLMLKNFFLLVRNDYFSVTINLFKIVISIPFLPFITTYS